jgi:hypothetical protein
MPTAKANIYYVNNIVTKFPILFDMFVSKYITT